MPQDVMTHDVRLGTTHQDRICGSIGELQPRGLVRMRKVQKRKPARIVEE
jgi:hypothetical protein